MRSFAAWKVGRKGLDDGVAMFVLADDRDVDDSTMRSSPVSSLMIGVGAADASKQTTELPVSFIQSVGDAVVRSVVRSIEVDKLREARRSPERDEAPHPGP